MDSAEDQGRAWMLADEHKFKMKRIREIMAEDRRRAEQFSLEEHRIAGEYWKKKAKSMKKLKRKAKLIDSQRPKTFVNWIPAAVPPLDEDRYLVWVRHNGSIIDGRSATFWYYPKSQVWEWTFKKKEGDEVDMWADITDPFWSKG